MILRLLKMKYLIIELLVVLIQGLNVTADQEWKLVFKAVTGGKGGVCDLYSGSSTANLDNVTEQSVSQKTTQHFKSDIINHWDEAGIYQVRLAVHKNNKEVAFFLFDGDGSSKMDWFRKERLIESSYTDIKNLDLTASYFRIERVNTLMVWFKISRTFYINYDMRHCPNETGWLLVHDVNSQNGCDWETMHQPHKPFILYSPLKTKTIFAEMSPDILADSLTVSVKFDKRSLTCQSMCSSPIQLDHSTFCYKPCNVSFDVMDKVKQLKKELTIVKNSTSSYRRKRTSIYDDRLSAKSVGYSGVFVIISICSFIVCMDCVSIKKKLDERKNQERLNS